MPISRSRRVCFACRINRFGLIALCQSAMLAMSINAKSFAYIDFNLLTYWIKQKFNVHIVDYINNRNLLG